jgi:hypothetical protein
MEALFLYYVTCFNPQTIGQTKSNYLLFVSFAHVLCVCVCVSSGAQTHLGAAHTHTFGSCYYACSGLVMDGEPITSPKFAGHRTKVCLGIIHLFGEKKEEQPPSCAHIP